MVYSMVIIIIKLHSGLIVNLKKLDKYVGTPYNISFINWKYHLIIIN
jgi:hypothetical protein